MLVLWGKIAFFLYFLSDTCGNEIWKNRFFPEIPQSSGNSVFSNTEAQQFPVLRLSLGYIRGQWLISEGGRRFAAYKGVPYAQPPVGKLRFEPPQEVRPWYGVRNALIHGSQCPQQLFVLNKYVGNEDCLYLNIYIPQINRDNEYTSNEALPIMVFIHGGAWVLGAGDMDEYLYGPDRLMDQEVILVTINYRLGALGFLYLDNAVPGNMGLKDQSLALKLVKANARAFGGDPNRIILMGESAGGASAEFHAMNPESRKSISGVIAQSGSVLSNWAWTRSDVLDRRAHRLARLLRCPRSTVLRQVFECLKNANARDIVQYQFLTNLSPLQIPIGVSFTPTNEPDGTPRAFLTECPRNVLVRLKNTRQTLPFLTGYNTREGQFFAKVAVSLVDSVLQSGARKHLNLPRESKSIAYIKRKPYVSQPSSDIVDNLLGDLQFKFPVIEASRHYASAGSNVFLYHFSFAGSHNFLRLFLKSPEPTHMDELTYLFKGRGIFGKLPRLESASPEAAVSERLIRMWTNFAKTGNPTPANNTEVDINWPLGPSKMLIIGKELTVGNSPLQTGWSSFVDKQCFL